MHLQQTKRESIRSGGAQYYFHDLTGAVKTYLRAQGAVSVALVTPYGATKSEYFAVSTDRKLDKQLKPIRYERVSVRLFLILHCQTRHAFSI